MILRDFKVFPRSGVIMAVDWGAARTGVAVSSPDRAFVFTRPVVNSRDAAATARIVADLARAEGAAGIVVGLPLRMDGSESDVTASVRDFANILSGITDLPICMLDETLTSHTAAEQGGFHTRRDARTKLDSASARVLLENAIAIINRL